MPNYKLGCCIPGASFMPEGVAEVKDNTLYELRYGARVILGAGFDYAEVGVGMIMKLSEDDFLRLCEDDIPLRAANSFIPPELKIVSDGSTDEGSPLYAYVDKAFYRMSRLGIGTVVFGSGGARRIPDGMDKEEGLSYIKKFLTMCGRLGEKHGVTLAIEPLRALECNAINYTTDGGRLVNEVSHPRVQYLADAFHMCQGDEPHNRLESATVLPVHIHVSEAPDRTYPGSHGGEYLTRFAESLQNTAYGGMISVECGFSDFEREVALAYKFVSERF